MINAGAIMVSSLVKSEMNTADRFEYMQGIFRRLAGDLHVGFNNSIYLSERSVADRKGFLRNTPISEIAIFDQLKLLGQAHKPDYPVDHPFLCHSEPLFKLVNHISSLYGK